MSSPGIEAGDDHRVVFRSEAERTVREVVAGERSQERDHVVALGWRQDDRARVPGAPAVDQLDRIGERRDAPIVHVGPVSATVRNPGVRNTARSRGIGQTCRCRAGRLPRSPLPRAGWASMLALTHMLTDREVARGRTRRSLSSPDMVIGTT
jgi:hypothetical protein